MIASVSQAIPYLSQSRVLLDIQRFAAKQTVSVSHISSEVVDRSHRDIQYGGRPWTCGGIFVRGRREDAERVPAHHAANERHVGVV